MPAETARLKYRQGASEYKEGHFRAAIDSFLEADQLAPSAALSFNIARAYEKIDDVPAALRWYRDYLRRAPDAPDRAQVTDVIHGFSARLAAKGLQQITVLSEPARATVSIDREPVGVTPWTGEVAPGARHIELRLEGYAPAETTVALPRDEAVDVQLKLEPASAKASPPPAAPPATTPSALAPAQGDKNSGSSHKSTLTTLGWIGIASGGAALGGGLVFEILRRGSESDARNDKTQIGYASKVETMESRQTAARILTVAGAALAVTGGVLLFLGRDHSTGITALGVECGPGTCGPKFHGRF
jgi:tetratricopeptide (TPR) repeat protein